MDNQNIIFPIGPGRCGTSLVTGLFAKMGAWVGSHSPRRPDYNPKGFFENFAFKRFVHYVYAGQGMECVTTKGWPQQTRQYSNPNFNEQLMGAIKQDGYVGGPAVLKNPQTAAIISTFKLYIPDAVYLFVDRDPEETVDSWKRKESHVDVPENLIREWVTNSNRVCKMVASHIVKMDSLIAGNTAVLEDIATDTGVIWNSDKAAEFIEPAYWHGKVNT